jgi:arylformamidase
MTYIDLTHDIHEKMPIFPGMSQPILERLFIINTHGYAETLINFLSHTGTHMDAPAHMLENGKTLDAYDVSSFIGNARVIDVQAKLTIELTDIRAIENEQTHIDYLLLYTGWSNFWGNDAYFRGFPVLSAEAAIWLANRGIKGIGLDCISADASESKDFPIHHILLEKDKLIVENLKNLNKLIGRTFMFATLPLKFSNSDGSPVRAIGWF